MKKGFRINTWLIAAMATIAMLVSPVAFAKTHGTAKYVFFFIGDGMGLPQKTAAAAYMGSTLLMDKFPAQGITTTHANDRFITGSAASATALATGIKTNINYIGVDPNYRPVKTLAEMAKEQGKKVGIISSVSIDHATPASFYAHVKTRKMYHEIDVALAKSGFDFFGGGGLKDPSGKKSKSPQGDALRIAKKNGYKIVSNKEDFMQLSKRDGKVIAWNEWLQDSQAMPYAIDMTERDITLPEFTEKAIELLDNRNGFFLMVEGGKIDWAAHANDAKSTITNNVAFDQSLRKAYNFYKKHPNETLIVVTGDHECGGLTLGFAGTKYSSNFDVLEHQKVSYQKFAAEIIPAFKKKNSGFQFDRLKPVITESFGLKFSGNPEKDLMVVSDYELGQIKEAARKTLTGKVDKNTKDYLMYGGYDPLTVTLTHILNQKAGLAWTSYKHTGVPVGTSAIGVGAEKFNGFYDNTDVAFKIMEIMGVKAAVYTM